MGLSKETSWGKREPDQAVPALVGRGMFLGRE